MLNCLTRSRETRYSVRVRGVVSLFNISHPQLFMKNAIWIGRRQVKGLIVLLALLPLVPTGFLIHTMWLKSSNEQERALDEMNSIFRNQLRFAAERFSELQSEPRGEAKLVEFLIHVFGEDLPMEVRSAEGKLIYKSRSSMTGTEFVYRIVGGEFSGWNISIDSVAEVPQHILEEKQDTFRQAVFALAGTILIAGGVWLIVNRGLRTDEIRKDLITTISHEIKTPVSAIKILTESLEAGDLDDCLQQEYLRLISSENERIEQLANRFLTYGRLEKGQLPIARKPTGLGEVLDRIASLLEPRFQAVNGEIAIKGDRDVFVMGDANGLTIVLTNLLENALKYGGSPPRVCIDISKTDQLVNIVIIDNGRGIPKSERRAVFRRFYRSSGRLDDGQTGVGLGLAICRRITKLMKGSLSLQSSQNKEYPGAEFQIRLSQAPATTV